VEPVTYVLPIRSESLVADELLQYVHMLARHCEVIVVDGSAARVFDDFAARCDGTVRHVPVDLERQHLINGKVAGVLTGVRLASQERLVFADDDVRYDESTLNAVVKQLDAADVVRPQNYFEPLPWHACLDTARSLINRVTGGDWPGTLAVRRSALLRSGGYDGNVLFENLELVRALKATGGREAVPRDLFVRRLPPSTHHFWSQRVRQAYDEWARPLRLVAWLSIAPLLVLLWYNVGAAAAAAALALTIVPAEIGRRTAGGAHVFSPRASLLAPVWICERALTAWVAVGLRIAFGGVHYRGRVIRVAANSLRSLQRRAAGQQAVHHPSIPAV
jgi:hypothetical protein